MLKYSLSNILKLNNKYLYKKFTTNQSVIQTNIKNVNSIESNIEINQIIKKPIIQTIHNEKRILRYSCEEIYDIVYNVNDYKNFMPWCIDSRTLVSKNYNIQELTVGFKSGIFNLSEKYTSKVEYIKNSSITAISLDNNIFHHLNSKWLFTPGLNPNTCIVHFNIEFAFKSEFHSHVANLFFEEVAKKIVSSFESRCRKLYGIR